MHFSTPDQLVNWALRNDLAKPHAIFLIDYEFIGFNQVGLDVIKYLAIQRNSILITSQYEESSVRNRCEQLGVQLIPKEMAAFVPIVLENKIFQPVSLILIDDDLLVHKLWELSASLKNLKIGAFYNLESFLECCFAYSYDTPLYVDVSLGHGIRGEDVSHKLHLLGFEKIYLTTGHSSEMFKKMEWVKSIVGKEFPL